MSTLLVFLPNQVSRAIALREKRMLIGRHATNAIALPDPLVSGVHAALFVTDSGWWIEDLGSRNGTWINRRRVHSSVLLPQDTLRIGRCTARLLLALDTDPLNDDGVVSEDQTKLGRVNTNCSDGIDERRYFAWKSLPSNSP
jgi:pSer/pThr/pTyr-binding forkhead associated (FHA) protein